jgi:hypothetical protein
VYLVGPDEGGDGLGDGRAVSSDHDGPGDAGLAHQPERPCGVGADAILQQKGSRELPVDAHEHRHHATCGRPLPDGRGPRDVGGRRGRPGGLAHGDGPLTDHAPYSLAGFLPDVCGRDQRQVTAPGPADDGRGQYVRGNLVEAGGQL